MSIKVSDNINIKLRSALYALLSFAIGFVIASIGMGGVIFLPILAALVGNTFFVDPTPKKVLGISLSCVIALLDFIPNGEYSVNCLFGVLCGFCLYFCVRRGLSKAECSVYITVLVILLFVSLLFLNAIRINDSFDISMAWDTVCTKLSYLKEEIVNYDFLGEMEANLPEGYGEIKITPELKYTFAKTVELFFAIVWGYVVGLAFVFAGFSIKMFYSLLLKNTSEKDTMMLAAGRFNTPNLLSWIFIALFVINLFAVNIDPTPFGAVIGNIYGALCLPFIYLGVRLIYVGLCARFGRVGGACVLLIGLALTVPTVVSILAFLGAVFAILHNKTTSKLQNKDGGRQ